MGNNMPDKKTGVVLMTYGSATVAENVAAYMEKIYRGKASAELVADFERRYRLVGHSPLVEITARQAAALQSKLGPNFIVRSGMRHSEPSIDSAIAACKDAGATELSGIILSPQFSSFIMEGYKTAFLDAARAHGFSGDDVRIAAPWPTQSDFIELLASRVRKSLGKLRALHGVNIPVIFTTHSLPERVVKSDPSYLGQLQATIDAVILALADSLLLWRAGYQSAGHTPETWLKPDLTDILQELRGTAPAVLIVPIQFLADHLEILYDLDIAAAEQCAEAQMAYNRSELPNDDALFIDALADIASKR
jgi:ferrochelatase